MEILAILPQFLVVFAHMLLQQAVVLLAINMPCTRKRLGLSALVLAIIFSVVHLNFHHKYGYVLIALWALVLALSFRIFFRQGLRSSLALGIGQLTLSLGMGAVGPFMVSLTGMDALPVNGVTLAVLGGTLALSMGAALLPENKLKNGRSRYLRGILCGVGLLAASIAAALLPPAEEVHPPDMVALLLVLCLTILLYVRGLVKISSLYGELEAERLHAASLENALSELRGFRHSYANILNTVSGLVSTGGWTGLQTYVKSLMADFQRVSATNVINDQLRPYPQLYEAALSALSTAKEQCIEFQISIQGEIVLFYCDPKDFGLVVEALLNNALESAADSKEKTVSLEMMRHRDQLRIVVESSCREGHAASAPSQAAAILAKYRRQGYAAELSVGCAGPVFRQVLVL